MTGSLDQMERNEDWLTSWRRFCKHAALKCCRTFKGAVQHFFGLLLLSPEQRRTRDRFSL